MDKLRVHMAETQSQDGLRSHVHQQELLSGQKMYLHEGELGCRHPHVSLQVQFHLRGQGDLPFLHP